MDQRDVAGPGLTLFLLVRHAAHDWLDRGLAGRMAGVSLNAQGRLQAEALVQWLAARPIDAIYSSPQPRARETVAPLARQRLLEVQLAPAFDEIDFGDWTGRDFPGLQGDPAWCQWNAQRSSASVPGGEAFADVMRRAAQGLEQLRRSHPGRTVLVVSHGDVIKALVMQTLGMPVDHLHRFEIAPASLSILQAGEGWLQLRLLNGMP